MSAERLSFAEIKTTKDLAALVERLESGSWVTIDTEFEREKTYYPDLCLIQVASASEAALIDPLISDLDLTPFFSLLQNPDVTKVFHAGRQDLEIFYKLTGAMVSPLFDTQIAGMVMGLGEAVGYETLVRRRLGIGVDKSWQVTNWKRRPLEQEQKDYAAADVIHLAALYPRLHKELASSGRLTWIAEELMTLGAESTYASAPNTAWQRVKGRVNGKQQFSNMAALAAWREEEAARRNIPRQRLLRDNVLLELANRRPKSINDLHHYRSLPNGFANSSLAEKVLTILNEGPGFSVEGLYQNKGRQTKANPAVVDILKLLLKSICEQKNIACRLVAVSDDLEKLALGEHEGLSLLQGWRHEIFGAAALDLLEGRLSLSIKHGKMSFDKCT